MSGSEPGVREGALAAAEETGVAVEAPGRCINSVAPFIGPTRLTLLVAGAAARTIGIRFVFVVGEFSRVRTGRREIHIPHGDGDGVGRTVVERMDGAGDFYRADVVHLGVDVDVGVLKLLGGKSGNRAAGLLNREVHVRVHRAVGETNLRVGDDNVRDGNFRQRIGFPSTAVGDDVRSP